MAKLMLCIGVITSSLLLGDIAVAQESEQQQTEWRADFSRESCYLWTTLHGDDPSHLLNINFLRFREGASTPLAADIQKQGGKSGELVLMILSAKGEGKDTEETSIKVDDVELHKIEASDAATMPAFFVGEPHSSEVLESLEKGIPAMLSATGSRRTTTALRLADNDKFAFTVRLAQSRACWDVIGDQSGSD